MSLLSIVIPSYNEESNIENTATVLARVLEAAQIEYELIFISDGSKDNTYNAVLREANKNPHIKGAEFSRNFGKEASIFAGLQLSVGDACIVMDCDLQYPPEVIPQMYELWQEGYEVVEGMKSDRGKESVFHRFFAHTFYAVMSKLMRIDMNASSDFKLLDRKVINVLLGLSEKNTFFRALTFWAGFKSTTFSYEVKQRQFGTSKWSFFSLMKYAISNTTSFTTLPLQIVTFAGVGSIFVSIIIAIQTLIRYFMGQSVEGFTTVILLILIIGGLIMLSLGIIGHYIARIYEEVKGRPKYIIRKVTDNVHGNMLGINK
jgi:polyisoprenyl-phosphate glycosyltransferase